MRYGRFGALAVGAVALAASAGLLVGGSGAAVAAGGGGSAPPWLSAETVAPLGSITFYNAQGQVVTGGSTTDPEMAAYEVASAPAPAPTGGANPYTTATLYEATPVANANPLTWEGNELSIKSIFPNTSDPGGIGTTANPVISGAVDVGATLQNAITSFPNTQTAAGYAGLYDIRMVIGGIGTNPEQSYYETVVSVNKTTGTWSVDYPDYTQNTTTKLTATPPTEATSGPITLTATVSPTADSAGTVSFWNGTTQVGTTQTVSSGGTASVTTTPPNGTTKYMAFFTPAISDSPAGAGNTLASYDIGSAGSLSYLVGTGPTATTTTLTASPTSTAPQGSSVTLTATLSPTNAAGTVAFEENGTVVGTQAVNSSGVAALTTTKLLPSAPNAASLTASFTPTDPSSFTTSTSTALTYTVNPVAAKPTISGQHKVGQTETCSDGTIDPGVTASYAWLASGKQIGTGKSFTVPASAYNKSLACKVSVHDGSGPTSSATSASVKVSLGNALRATKKPALSGSRKVGKTERVKAGTWSQKSGVKFTYQWLLNGKVIKHATKSSFKPTKSDKGKKLSCRVTAHKAGYANGSATTSSVTVSS